ncbi:MAG: 50S ribosomal protein L11 methyltransferase [Aquificae bacterium]|nr:50S ribosomal protein L11 methyltransferase [Aquificota bacterium]
MFRFVLHLKPEDLLKAYETYPGGFEVVRTYPDGSLDIAVYSEERPQSFPFPLVAEEEVRTKDWREFYKPVEVGRETLIVPPWETRRPEDKTVVVIKPGKAFGTGLHESTQLCLELMEELDLKEKTVLDVGSGSGILSIFALKRGAKKAVAVDVDPLAVEETLENAVLNGVADRIEVLQGGPSAVKGIFDLVLANLELKIFKRFLDQIAPKVGKEAVFSGLYGERELEDMLRLLERFNLEPLKVASKNDWHALLVRRG